jgi:hypothetical protein
MKKLTLLFASLTLVLTACLFDKEDKDSGYREFQFTGKLSDLVSDTGSGQDRAWLVPLDSGEALEMKGECVYRGYLGDSASVMNNGVAALYTNDYMQGTRMAERWHENGAHLSADSAHFALTHYRADFECQE